MDTTNGMDLMVARNKLNMALDEAVELMKESVDIEDISTKDFMGVSTCIRITKLFAEENQHLCDMLCEISKTQQMILSKLNQRGQG